MNRGFGVGRVFRMGWMGMGMGKGRFRGRMHSCMEFGFHAFYLSWE